MKLKSILLSTTIVLLSLILFSNCSQSSTGTKDIKTSSPAVAAKSKDTVATTPVNYPPLNKKLYDSLMKKLAHGDTTGKWPVKNAPYPLPGAILPFKRVVAFYGNLCCFGCSLKKV